MVSFCFAVVSVICNVDVLILMFMVVMLNVHVSVERVNANACDIC